MGAKMNIAQLIVTPLAAISIAVMYVLLWAFIVVMWVIDNVMIALDAVAEFLDHHVIDQVELLKRTWGVKGDGE